MTHQILQLNVKKGTIGQPTTGDLASGRERGGQRSRKLRMLNEIQTARQGHKKMINMTIKTENRKLNLIK